jgi:CheY-like chemotaxis protein
MNKGTRHGGAEGHVLVVDDDEAVREVLSDVLRDEGYLVESAENGAVALGYLETHDLPCIIVLDLMMPVMSGVEFRARQLAEPRLAKIPVIVMSAADRGREIALTLHADSFMPKPPTVSVLLDAIQRYC